MFVARMPRIAAVLVGAMVATACVATPNAFDRHDWQSQNRLTAADAAAREYCPVVVSNRTSAMLEAGYRIDGVSEELGVIPEGGSTRFDVRCDFGKIEAFGSSDMGILAGPGQEYRKLARLDRFGVTRIEFRRSDEGR